MLNCVSGCEFAVCNGRDMMESNSSYWKYLPSNASMPLPISNYMSIASTSIMLSAVGNPSYISGVL